MDSINLLQKNDFVASGFIALHTLQSDTYVIKNIATKEESPLMQRIADLDKRPNHFKFFSEGVDLGNLWMKNILEQTPDIAVVDEIGGFELNKELWYEGFTSLLASDIPLIFTVKAKLLDRVLEKWNINPTYIFDSSYAGKSQVAFEIIKKFLR